MKITKQRVAIFLLFLAAIAIRCIGLNQSLWLDEGVTARVIHQYSLIEIVTKFLPQDFHPPLYYFLMSVYRSIAEPFLGNTEIMLRIPSIIASIVAGIFIYKIVKSFANQSFTEGWFAIAFFLFNPLIVYYSQEARMYMMATMFITGGLYFIQRSTHNYQQEKAPFSEKYSFLAGTFLSLSFATFYGSIFIVIPILGYLILKKKYKEYIVICCSLIVTSLFLSPLLYQQLMNARGALSIVANWKQALGPASVKNLLLIFIKFTSGRISFEPKSIYYALSGIWMILIWFFVFRGGRKQSFLLLTVLCSLFLAILVSFITPLLQYFRFLFLIPLVSILLVFGATRMNIRILILAGFIGWSLLYVIFPVFHREDWSSLARLIDSTKPVYAIPSSMDALIYYRPDLKNKIYDAREINQPRDLPTNLQLSNSLAVIPYTFDIYGFDYRQVFGTMGYMQQSARSVRGLQVEIWSKK